MLSQYINRRITTMTNQINPKIDKNKSSDKINNNVNQIMDGSIFKHNLWT